MLPIWHGLLRGGGRCWGRLASSAVCEQGQGHLQPESHVADTAHHLDKSTETTAQEGKETQKKRCTPLGGASVPRNSPRGRYIALVLSMTCVQGEHKKGRSTQTTLTSAVTVKGRRVTGFQDSAEAAHGGAGFSNDAILCVGVTKLQCWRRVPPLGTAYVGTDGHVYQ